MCAFGETQGKRRAQGGRRIRPAGRLQMKATRKPDIPHGSAAAEPPAGLPRRIRGEASHAAPRFAAAPGSPSKRSIPSRGRAAGLRQTNAAEGAYFRHKIPSKKTPAVRCRRRIRKKPERAGGSFLRAPRPPLSTELQTLYERVVAVKRRAFEIVEELSAAARHCDEPAARVEVLFICGEVVGEVRNARRKYGHLNFAGTRVAFRDGEFLDYFLFVYRLVFGHFQSFVAARILGPSPEEPRPSAVPDRRLNSAHLGGVSRNAPQRPERFPARRSAAHSDAFFYAPTQPARVQAFFKRAGKNHSRTISNSLSASRFHDRCWVFSEAANRGE